MKKILTLLLLCFILLLTACGQTEETPDAHDSSHDNEVVVAPLNVKISLKPEMIQVNETATIQAKVTHGEEVVEDADEVVFEIWKEGQEKHQEIEGTHQGEGIYAIEQTFEKPGDYNVIAHVTARQMHNMPKQTFTVKE